MDQTATENTDTLTNTQLSLSNQRPSTQEPTHQFPSSSSMRFGYFLILVVAFFAVGCLDLSSAVKITAIEDLWKNALPKVKAVRAFRGAGKVGAAKNSWKGLSDKLKVGQLKNLDTMDINWQKAIVKVDAAGKLNKVDEAKIVKVTESVAQEVAKNPSKWHFVYKALLVTFGVAVTALIVAGLVSMSSK